MTPDFVTVASALSASLGTFVSYQAYRGYRRHRSEAMALLAFGIACFTAIPFVISVVVAPAFGWSDALTLLGIVAAYNAGLLAILWSLHGD